MHCQLTIDTTQHATVHLHKTVNMTTLPPSSKMEENKQVINHILHLNPELLIRFEVVGYLWAAPVGEQSMELHETKHEM